MTVLLPFVVNAGLNFVLGLLIAYFLGPAEFGRYAIGAALMILVNTALLDWIRISAMRFYSQAGRESRPEIRATLDVLIAGVTMALCGLLVAAVAAGVDFRLPAMLVGASVLAGITAGLFDYHGAIARGRYLDGVYARLILVKNVLALLLMVGGAWLTRDPAIVLFGSVVSVGVALLSVRRALVDVPLSLQAVSPALAWRFACYAFPLVAANALYSLTPLLNRSWLAATHGFAEAGYFSLASDMGLRLFGALAAGLEIVLLREVIRLDETRGRAMAERRIARNLAVVAAVLLPVAVGFWLVRPDFEALLVPASFHGPFAAYLGLLLPGFLALAVFQAGLYPVFLLNQRTGVATLAAALGLAVNLALVLASAGMAPLRFALAQSAGLFAALVITAFAALRALSVRPPLRDLAGVLAATVIMGHVVWPLAGRFAPAVGLTVQVAAGAVSYLLCLYAFDVLRLRTLSRRWLRRRQRRKAPAIAGKQA